METIKLDTTKNTPNIANEKYSQYVNEETVSSLREQANKIIEDKIEKGIIDPQSLPLVDEWLNELYLLECKISKRDRALEEYYAIEREADRFAQNIVFIERKKRIEAIEHQYKIDTNKIQIEEDENTILDNENKRFVKDRKRARKRIRAERKRKKQEAKLDKLEDELKKDKIQREQETKDKLHEVIKQETESAHKIKQMQNDLKQKEHEAAVQRAQTNERLESLFDQEKQEWKIKQEKLEKTWENENKAMVADYSARIAKSEREMAEDLMATHEARDKAFKEEKLRSEKLQEALKDAEKSGKLKSKINKAKLSNIIPEKETNIEIINKFYNEQKQTWHNPKDIDKTIIEFEKMMSNTKNNDEIEAIKKKISVAKRTRTKMIKDSEHSDK